MAKRKSQKFYPKTYMLLAGAISLFAFLTFFLPPLTGAEKPMSFDIVYFSSENYYGAVPSLIAYVMILASCVLFFLCAFVINKDEKTWCLIATLLLVASGIILLFTANFYVNSLHAPEWVNPDLVEQVKAEQLEITKLGIGAITGVALSWVSALAGLLCIRSLKGK
ncbi:MAG: hypothetical protein II988_03830 [Clostridia bacterium]|nr:hypothetical protein [Clostridia bacterium]